jgi:hypothetical protein
MTVGSELKQARVRAGLSPEEISERTKIQLYKIDALEKGDFELLPQGIYLDGIVRAYAHEVALDSERMVERVRLERGKLPGDWEVPFAAPIDLHPASAPNDVRVVQVSDGEDGLGGFATEEDDLAAPPAAHDVRHEPDDMHFRPVPYEPYLQAVPEQPGPKPAPQPKYILDQLRATHMSRRPRRRRSNVAVPVVLVLLAAIGWGGYWYESNRRSGRIASADLSASAAPERGAASADRPDAAVSGNTSATPTDTARGGAPVAFSENVVSPDNDAERRPSSAAANTASASAVPGGDTARGTSGRTAGTASRTSPTPRTRTLTTPDPPVVADRRASATAATRPSAAEARGSAAPPPVSATRVPAPAARSVPDVSGSWKLATQVESSSLGRFQGLQLGYEMQLEQNGDRVTGVGRKVTENGGGVGSRAQTPISVNGTVSGGRVTLTFIEGGLQRSTQGKFVLLLEEDGTLRGRFSSNAAQSSGRVEAHRVARQ